MQDADLGAWMALHQTPNLSDKIFSRLIQAVDRPHKIFSLSKESLKLCGVCDKLEMALNKSAETLADQNVERLKQHNIQIIPISSDNYPHLLKQINDPPPLLYARGNINLLDSPQLAIVGSRRASKQALDNAYAFGSLLSAAGFTITSGLALGIDAASHQGALDKKGGTIGVLGTGIDQIYPRRNRVLFEEMYEQGLVISEFPLGMPPLRSCFPKRNRIISGLSLGVLVVEAALRSGSLITARMALEHNREVFAIPASIHHAGGKGCNALIQQGAALVERASDIMEQLSGWLPTSTTQELSSVASRPAIELSPQEHVFIDALGFDPVNIETLEQRLGLDISQLNALITLMEMKGCIEQRGGLYYRVV